VDEYLTAIREIEKRIQTAEGQGRELTPGIEKPSGIPITFAEYLKLMYDLQVVAFQSDLTRVSTLMVGREGSLRVYPEIGIPDPHHPLTHHRNNADWIEKVTRINCHHVEMLAYFLGRLAATPDGDGSLLDNTMIVYGSGLSDGNRHTHEQLPVLLAGRGGGTLNPGRHLTFADGTPITNLYVSILERMGVRPESMGDSTGTLKQLSGLEVRARRDGSAGASPSQGRRGGPGSAGASPSQGRRGGPGSAGASPSRQCAKA
jgi:hypothetical protein